MADSDTLQSEISTATETVFHGPDLMSVLTGAAGSVLKIIRDITILSIKKVVEIGQSIEGLLVPHLEAEYKQAGYTHVGLALILGGFIISVLGGVIHVINSQNEYKNSNPPAISTRIPYDQSKFPTPTPPPAAPYKHVKGFICIDLNGRTYAEVFNELGIGYVESNGEPRPNILETFNGETYLATIGVPLPDLKEIKAVCKNPN